MDHDHGPWSIVHVCVLEAETTHGSGSGKDAEFEGDPEDAPLSDLIRNEAKVAMFLKRKGMHLVISLSFHTYTVSLDMLTIVCVHGSACLHIVCQTSSVKHCLASVSRYVLPCGCLR